MIITIIAIAIGLLMCFLGYKIFKIWLAVAGLVLGAQLGYYLGGLVGASVWPVVGAIVVGILLAVLAFFLFKVGAVIIGALIGAYLTVALFDAFNAEPVWWALLIGAVIVGALALIFLKPFIIIGSSLLGAYLTVGGVYALITQQTFYQMQGQAMMFRVHMPWYVLLIALVLAVVAALIQSRYTKQAPELAA